MDNWSFIIFTAVSASALLVSSELADPNCLKDVRHPNGPLIIPCKKEIILNMGENYTLTCKGKYEINFNQQEVPEEVIGNFNITTTYKTIIDEEFNYQVDLNLHNVDQYAIGYYACSDASDKTDFLNNLIEEPNNTESVTYIYVYVDGTDSLFAPLRELVLPKSNNKFVIECRPSTPDVQVNLSTADIPDNNIRYSPKIGFILACDVLTELNGITIFTCLFMQQDSNRLDSKDVYVKKIETPPMPTIVSESEWFLEGETFTLNCTVPYKSNFVVHLSWKYPNDYRKDIIDKSNTNESTRGLLYRSITIVNATKSDAGLYTCVSKNNCGENRASKFKTYLAKPVLKLIKGTRKDIFETKQKNPALVVEIENTAYPPPTFYFKKNNKKINSSEKYKIRKIDFTGEVELKILNAVLTDSGNYTFVADNGYQIKQENYDLRILAAPIINNFQDASCVRGMAVSLVCKVAGYPLPKVTWILSDNETQIELESTSIDIQSIYNVTAYLDVKQCINSGKVTCKAVNSQNTTLETKNLYLYEMPNGFGIDSDKVLWLHENNDVIVKCLASKYVYENVTWFADDNHDIREHVEYFTNNFSHIAYLKINEIALNDSGKYVCQGLTGNGIYTNDSINIHVEELREPLIKEPPESQDYNANRYQPVKLVCHAEGVPKPNITWFKDGVPLQNTTSAKILYRDVNRNVIISTIDIGSMQQELEGKYECIARNSLSMQNKAYTLILDAEPVTKYLIAIAVIVLVLMILVGYLMWKVKKEKQFRKELAAAGLLYFKEGVTKSLNPELGIDEQAELLPYDERFEFPADKLKLGKQLGAGAFGVVYKAEARGIINAEETTPVAVKMVKKTADNMYIKALASELKIMVHLGKHINIVNLLGACTKNVGKRELVVIVEYCKFGNIHNYIMRHRDVFIDQLTDSNKEKNLGKINQAFSCTGSTGTQSDYYGCTNTQETDHTFINTANTNRSGRKNVTNNQRTETVKASEGYVQPEWRSNYESDYSYDGRTPRPLTSRDLLAWAFQIARGMEYLAGRKVLHGDLAARNVLLAEDNIVKICDFGLARSIYKNDEYQKKENSPLPVKWLAIECMTDRIFSTQSDVWSFGIVLWELFSLAKTPYPNISPTNLLQFLSEGNRLDKPAYADDRLYEVMKRCWEQKPTARPSFTQLQELLGTFLEDNVRNHYVDLNSAFADMNPKSSEHEDYLAMVSAPDYNNMVTPSPHHYVNDTRSFFPPTPSKVDEEGYLQMSPANQNIFSPRSPNAKFDFDPRKFNPRPSETGSCGSELTPMLTLNNLPTRSGSESDQEGNASPYLNMCPRIEEETDEVFDTRLNNAKNHATNLMYITLDKDIEKKPNNNYVNINVPNGLVK